jgi:tRNA nucleotidyltransferase (CCA-adding enzyme)
MEQLRFLADCCIKKEKFRGIAQLAEPHSVKMLVEGSSPSPPATYHPLDIIVGLCYNRRVNTRGGIIMIKIPEHIKLINNKLGGNCFLVGGCVRDSMIGREINDYDIASSNTPEDILALSSEEFQVNPVGISFGVVQIVIPGNQPVEHATFRGDGEYTDLRRPQSVGYLDNIETDLLRRDFRMNAMAYDISNECLVDPLYGSTDIFNQEICFVGDAGERIKEDPLRMLRAIRFASQLGFYISDSVVTAIIEHKELVLAVAKERITVEWFKICSGDNVAQAVGIMNATGLLDIIFPELAACRGIGQNRHHREDVRTHCLETFTHMATVIHTDRVKKIFSVFGVDINIPVIMTAALLHDCGKAISRSVDNLNCVHFYEHEKVSAVILSESKSLRLSHEDKKSVWKIAELHMVLLQHIINSGSPRLRSINKILNKTGNLFPYIYAHTMADMMASVHEDDFGLIDVYTNQIIAVYVGSYKVYKEKPLVNGRDLIELGFKPGEIFSEILDQVSSLFVEAKISTRDEALMWISQNYSKGESNERI